MREVTHIVVMLSFPDDAKDAAERLRKALTQEWNDDTGVLTGLAVDVLDWLHEPGKPHSDDGTQGSFNESILSEADYVVALFERNLGNKWTSKVTNKEYPSGTVAEIELGFDQDKTVRIFALGSASDSTPWLQGPDDRQARLRTVLRDLDSRGFSIIQWRDPDDLAAWVKKTFSADLRRGDLRLKSAARPRDPIFVTRQSRSLDLPKTYVARQLEADVRQAWDDGFGRVALIGDGGVGKSLVARRLLDDALQAGNARPDLVIFAEPATSANLTLAYAEAANKLGLADPLPQLGDAGRDARMAGQLMATLRTAQWPWLVILDNADPGVAADGTSTDAIDDLVRTDLLPPGSPLGRTLMTTRQRGGTLGRFMHEVKAECFTNEEAVAFLRQPQFPGLRDEGDDALRDLANEVDRLPLAMSIAAATIVESRVSSAEWLQRFREAASLDDVTVDANDPDGYPVKLSQVWQVTLASAAVNEPTPGITARAALVCSVLNPDGHPGWLWQTDEIVRYLWQDADPKPELGRPQVLRQLHNHSVIEFAAEPEARWPSEWVSMHRLAARAIQGQWSEEEVEKAVRACADGFMHADFGSPSVRRSVAMNLVAMLDSRGNGGLIIEDDEGWVPHDLITEVLDIENPIGGLPLDTLNAGLAALMPKGSGSLASLRIDLAQFALFDVDWEAAEAYANLAEDIDESILAGDWSQMLHWFDIYISGIRMQMRTRQAFAHGGYSELASFAEDMEAPLDRLMVELILARCQTHPSYDAVRTAAADVTREITRNGDTIESMYVAGLIMGSCSKEVADELLSIMNLSSQFVGVDVSSIFEIRLATQKDLDERELASLHEEASLRFGPGSSAELATLAARAYGYFRDGQHAEAALVYAECVEQFTRSPVFGPRHPETLRMRRNLAVNLQLSGETSQALDLLPPLLQDCEHKLGQNDPESLAVLKCYADTLRDEKRYQEALDFYVILMQRYSENPLFGPDDADSLLARNNWLFCLDQTDRQTESVELYPALLVDRDRLQGELDSNTLMTLSNYANALATLKRYDEAADRYHELARRYDTSPEFGPEHVKTLWARGECLYCLNQAGRHAESIDMYPALITDRDRIKGELDPNTLATLRNYAIALAAMNRNDEAAERYRELAQRYETSPEFGPEHTDTLWARHCWLYYLDQVGHQAESVDLYPALLADRDRIQGELDSKTLATLRNYAKALVALRRNDEAAQSYRELAGRYATSPEFGPEHADTLWARHEWLSYLDKAGRQSESVDLYPALLADCCRIQSELHVNTLGTLKNYANALAALKHYDAASERFRKLARLYDIHPEFGPEHADTLWARHCWLYYLDQAGSLAESVDMYPALLADCDRIQGELDSNTLATLRNYSDALAELNRNDEAAERYKELARRYSISPEFGPEHARTLWAQHELLTCLGQAGRHAESIDLYPVLLADLDRTQGELDSNTLVTLRHFADALTTLEWYGEAAGRYQELARRYNTSSEFGPEHPDTLRARHNWLACLDLAGHQAESVDLYRVLLADLDRIQGELDSNTFGTLECFANTLATLKCYDDAADRYRELARRYNTSSEFGPEHLETLWARHEWLFYLDLAGRQAESIDAYPALLNDRDRIQGELDSNTLVTLKNYASALVTLKRLDEAAEQYRELARRYATSPDFGPEHAGTLWARHEWLTYLSMAGRQSESVVLYPSLLADHDRLHGELDSHALIILRNYADTLADLKRNDDAADRYRELARRYAASPEFGSEHADVLWARHEWLFYLDQAGYQAESIDMYQALLADSDRIQGELHSSTLVTLQNFANALAALNRYDEAAEHYQELARRYDASPDFGTEHADTLWARCQWLSLLDQAGRQTESVDLYPALIADLDRTLGELDSHTLVTMQNYADALAALGRYGDAATTIRELAERRTAIASGNTST